MNAERRRRSRNSFPSEVVHYRLSGLGLGEMIRMAVSAAHILQHVLEKGAHLNRARFLRELDPALRHARRNSSRLQRLGQKLSCSENIFVHDRLRPARLPAHGGQGGWGHGDFLNSQEVRKQLCSTLCPIVTPWPRGAPLYDAMRRDRLCSLETRECSAPEPSRASRSSF